MSVTTIVELYVTVQGPISLERRRSEQKHRALVAEHLQRAVDVQSKAGLVHEVIGAECRCPYAPERLQLY